MSWPFDARYQVFVDGTTNIVAAFLHALQDEIMNERKGRSKVSTSWGNWSAPIGANIAYAGEFLVSWTGAVAPGARAPTGDYSAPAINLESPVNADTSWIAVNETPGLVYPNSSLYVRLEVDAALSVIGANNAQVDLSLASGIFSTNFGGARFKKASADTNWKCETNDGAATTTTDSGVPPVANLFQRFRIEWYGSALTGGARVVFSINGTVVATHTTHLYASQMALFAGIKGTAANATLLRVGHVLCEWSRVSGL